MQSSVIGEESSAVDNDTENKKNKFSSTLSSYITQLGQSMGTSDFWKFPFLSYRNGGGAFLIPFVTMVIVCGIPMYFLEYSMGKFSSRGPYQVWDICPLFRGVGLTICLAYAVYMIGTTILRCWIIQFLFYAVREPIPWTHCRNQWNTQSCERPSSSTGNLTLDMATDLQNISTDVSSNISPTLSPNTYTMTANMSFIRSREFMSSTEEFWQYKVLHLSSGISDFSPVIWRYFFFLFILRTIVLLCNIKSIKSIEKVVWLTATLPIVMSVAIFIRSMTLPGAHIGLSYFFYPEFDKIFKAQVWIEASLMAFYTLSFGWGTNVLLGSHASFKENCLRTATLLPVIDMSVAVFNGMVCFCVLGNMAHINNINITEVISAGMATGMVSYITAVSSFPLPQLWSVLFLISLLLTGLDGQVVPFDMLMQLFGDLFPRRFSGHRIQILLILSFAMFVFGLPMCCGNGGYIFLWIEWYVAAWFGPIVAFIEAIVVAWIYGLDRFNEDIHMMIGRDIPCILRLGMAFILPIILPVIFFTSLIEYVPPKYGSYSYPLSARVVGWATVFATALPVILQAVYLIRKSDGPCSKTIVKLVKPLESWGPGAVKGQMDYNAMKSKYSNRTMKDLFHYNFFGKYRDSSAMNAIKQQEMDLLGSGIKPDTSLI